MIRKRQAQNKVIGNCLDEALVIELFGSVTEFANQVEKNGDDFNYGEIRVSYDPEKDIHYFYWR